MMETRCSTSAACGGGGMATPGGVDASGGGDAGMDKRRQEKTRAD